ncbi:MAG: glycerophosphodiester phosphodiesterase [Streptosporangiales bacterium]|nr:glycerophosphodiester phosphodiesterase [Streptosporangiales bacterium]
MLVGVVTVLLVTIGGVVGGRATLGAVPSDEGGPVAESKEHAKPLVLGHRGAAGYRPEHTRGSYDLAARMGADYIEPDLVSTKDHVLVARHENDITATTDVSEHPEFASRKTTKTIDGTEITGWFTEDFTLAELKTLRAKERIPDLRQENTLYDGRYEVLTLQEVFDLRERLERELHRPIGLLPELKHSTYFSTIGLDLESAFVETLRKNHLDSSRSRVTVQSFEVTNLRELKEKWRIRIPTVFNTSVKGRPYDFVVSGDPRTYADLTKPAELRRLARFVDILGPEKQQVIPLRADGTLGEPTSLVKDAHRAGIQVMPYTFRAENSFLPKDYQVGDDPSAYGRAIDEQRAYLDTGIDGLWCDQPDICLVTRDGRP